MITAALIGAGHRGAESYAIYALKNPQEVKFVSVAEIDPVRRERFQQDHGIEDSLAFESWEQLLAGPKLADAILICTQDRMHFEPAMKALEKGYHVLLEKPMSPVPQEVVMMGQFAEKYNRVFSICHVLRYTPFYRKMKQLLEDDEIGRLVSIQHSENVEYRHQSHSFVRGNWRNSETSSPMILQKSCHDMDILLWLAGADCTKVSSFGSLTHFRSESAPEGAPKYCLDGCPVQDECPYYAPKIYLENEDWETIARRRIISNDDSYEGVLNVLKDGPYGRCVYHCDNNVVDHQVVNLEFANEVTVAFTMCAFTKEGGRTMKLMGTRGQIRASMDQNIIELSNFITGETKIIEIDVILEGHGGGDDGIMRDFVRLVENKGQEAGLTGARISVQSHLMAFAAEKSRLESKVIQLSDYMEELKSGS